MTGLVEVVEKNIDSSCIVSKMKKSGCTVSLSGAPLLRLIVDFDQPGSPLDSNQQRCDYLFIAEEADRPGWVALLELKKGRLRTSEVVGQLKASTRAAEQLVPQSAAVRFRPIVALGGGIHKAERTALKQKSNKVRFHKECEFVRLIHCDSALAQELRA